MAVLLSTIVSTGIESKLRKILNECPDGSVYRKIDLAEHFGFTSLAVVEKWNKRYSFMSDHKVYVPINNGRNREAVYTNRKYRKQLLDNGTATEKY